MLAAGNVAEHGIVTEIRQVPHPGTTRRIA